MKKVSIFGATGSIGQNTIDLIARAPDAYDVVALTGASNIAQLAEDAQRLNAQLAVTAHEHLLDDLRDALSGTGVEAAAGTQAINEAAARPADWVMSAIIGAAGLAPGMEALKQARRVTICASSDGATCVGGWGDGYIVFVDSAATDAAAPVPIPALGAIKKWGPLGNGASLTVKFDGAVDTNYIRFTSLGGFARPVGGETSVEVDVVLAPCSGINVPRITVSLTGMVGSIDRACR